MSACFDGNMVSAEIGHSSSVDDWSLTLSTLSVKAESTDSPLK
uniref:Transposase n=1 Tax=Schistosoma curassoni TaxID=6186 RepID=A0A183JK94_9TREM